MRKLEDETFCMDSTFSASSQNYKVVLALYVIQFFYLNIKYVEPKWLPPPTVGYKGREGVSQNEFIPQTSYLYQIRIGRLRIFFYGSLKLFKCLFKCYVLIQNFNWEPSISLKIKTREFDNALLSLNQDFGVLPAPLNLFYKSGRIYLYVFRLFRKYNFFTTIQATIHTMFLNEKIIRLNSFHSHPETLDKCI